MLVTAVCNTNSIYIAHCLLRFHVSECMHVPVFVNTHVNMICMN